MPSPRSDACNIGSLTGSERSTPDEDPPPVAHASEASAGEARMRSSRCDEVRCERPAHSDTRNTRPTYGATFGAEWLYASGGNGCRARCAVRSNRSARSLARRDQRSHLRHHQRHRGIGQLTQSENQETRVRLSKPSQAPRGHSLPSRRPRSLSDVPSSNPHESTKRVQNDHEASKSK